MKKILIIMIIVSTTFFLYGEEIVNIPDANLKSLLKEVLGVQGREITDVDMEGLTELYGENRNILDLTGLEYAVNLTRLSLYQNSVEDLGPLSGLNKLAYVHLNENRIADLTPLANKRFLRTLYLNDNKIISLEGLGGNARLTVLTLGGNEISNINQLDGLDSLTRLGLAYNDISDLSPLTNNTSLTDLSLYENQVSDLSPLSNNIQLTKLELDYNRLINDLSPLTNLTALTYLSLNVNQITDVSHLTRLINLERLELSANLIESVSPLSGMTQLKYLSLGGNAIYDISPLADLKELNYLILNNNELTDISSVSGMSKLLYLEIQGNRIAGLPDLENLNKITEFNLGYNMIENIDPIEDLTTLEKLFLNNNRVKDCTPLSGLSQLDLLYLENNRIIDIFPLATLTGLKSLMLAYNYINDCSPLAGLTSLINLTLNHNRLNDRNLIHLTQLDELTNGEIYFDEFGDYGYFDLRDNLGFSEAAIRLLADRLEKIDYEHILWDEMDRVFFTEYPRTAGMTDVSTRLVWAFNGEVKCTVYVAEKNNAQSMAKYGTEFQRIHQLDLSGLSPGTAYVYKIRYFTQDDKELGETRLLLFETLDDFRDKKIQLRGKPAILSLTDEEAVIEVFTDYPVENVVCSLYNQNGPVETQLDSENTQRHRFEFSGLASGEGYSYRLGARLAVKTIYVPLTFIFRTRGKADVNSPLILEGPFLKADSSKALIMFKTNEGCLAEIDLWQSVSGTSVERTISEDYYQKHVFFIDNLSPNTGYEYSIVLKDHSDNVTHWRGESSALRRAGFSFSPLSSGNQFTTEEQSDQISPYYLSRPNLIACYDSLAAIQWNTNEPCRYRLNVFSASGNLVEVVEQSEPSNEFFAFLNRLAPGEDYSVNIHLMDMNENVFSDTAAVTFVTRDQRTSPRAELIEPLKVYREADFSLLSWETDLPCDSRTLLDNQLPADNGALLYDGGLKKRHVLIFNEPVDSAFYGKYFSADLIENVVFESGEQEILNPMNNGDDSLFTLKAGPEVVYTNPEMIFINWETNKIAAFSVEYYSTQNPEETLSLSSTQLTEKQSLKVFDLEPSTGYHFQLDMMTVNGDKIHKEISANTAAETEKDLTAPSLPDSLSLTRSDQEVTLSWSSSSSFDVNDYDILVEENDSVSLLYSNLKVYKWNCSFEGSFESKKWGIQALDFRGNKSEIAWFNEGVNVDGTEHLTGRIRISNFYPNPSSKCFSCEIGAPKACIIDLCFYNILGEKTYERKIEVNGNSMKKIKISTTGWGNGIYVYSFENSERTIKHGKVALLK